MAECDACHAFANHDGGVGHHADYLDVRDCIVCFGDGVEDFFGRDASHDGDDGLVVAKGVGEGGDGGGHGLRFECEEDLFCVCSDLGGIFGGCDADGSEEVAAIFGEIGSDDLRRFECA